MFLLAQYLLELQIDRVTQFLKCLKLTFQCLLQSFVGNCSYKENLNTINFWLNFF